MTFAASTIAAIYRQRWPIEIFFKTLKQHLKIKTFVGTSGVPPICSSPGGRCFE